MRFLVISLLATAPAMADEIIPQGCSAFLTVQMANCTVSHYYTCEGEADGLRWRASMDRDGLRGRSQVDMEYRWIYSTWREGQQVFELVIPETDPASVTELLATSRDDFDFERRYFEDGLFKGTIAVVGFDELTGETAVIDGEELLVTRFSNQNQIAGGYVLSEIAGQQYVHPEHRLFFGGTETHSDADGNTVYHNYAPVTFAHAGDDDFLETTPQFGCDAMMSGLFEISEEREGVL